MTRQSWDSLPVSSLGRAIFLRGEQNRHSLQIHALLSCCDIELDLATQCGDKRDTSCSAFNIYMVFNRLFATSPTPPLRYGCVVQLYQPFWFHLTCNLSVTTSKWLIKLELTQSGLIFLRSEIPRLAASIAISYLRISIALSTPSAP